MYLELLAEGKTEMGESGSPPRPPPKFDMDKFERGRIFIHEHVICHALAMFISLVCGLSVVNLLEPLLFTNQSNTTKKALKRYESTFAHLVKWYYGDVWDPNDRAHKSILAVRNIHNNVRKSMTADDAAKESGHSELEMSACPINRHNVRLSQYDMSLVQCGFIGSIVMYPDSLGMRCTEDELDDFVYFWYAIGHLLGITDKNNICRDGYKVTRAICKEIEQEVLLPSMKDAHPQFIPMAKALVEGSNIRHRFNLFSVESTIAMGYYGMQQEIPKLSLLDYCRYLFLRAFINILYFCPLVKKLFCKLIQKVFWGSAKVSKIKRQYN